jgi:DNA modification methylase
MYTRANSDATDAPVQTGAALWPADQIERWPIERLVPYARNARTHTPAQIDQIAASIREWGWTMPILVDENGTILAGHARVLAARKLGLAEVPVIVARGWSEAQKHAYVLADNKLTLNSGWDEELLRIELADLKLQDFDLGLLGFDDTELERILNARSVGATDPDDVPPVPVKPVARPGDIWQLGRHLLLCGDATSAEDVGRLLAGANPHLCVSDPPYGVEYDPSWRERDLECWKKPRSLGAVQNDNQADWSAAWRLFSGDVIYAWSPAGASMIEHYQALVAAGFEIRVQIIWAKPHFPIGRGNYHHQHETCWYAVHKGKTAHWNGDRTQSTLWQIDNASAFKGSRGIGNEQTGHGTQKPVECMRRPIENNSNPGDAVFDPFVGSGTTIIAAEMTGRKCLAIEISPAYCDVAILRWQDFTEEKAMLDGRTFAEVQAARHNDNAHPAGSVQEGPNAVEDIGAGVSV